MKTNEGNLAFFMLEATILFLAKPISFMSKAGAPCETVQNIRMISRNTTFGVSVKERVLKIIRLYSPWRQDHGWVVRC